MPKKKQNDLKNLRAFLSALIHFDFLGAVVVDAWMVRFFIVRLGKFSGRRLNGLCDSGSNNSPRSGEGLCVIISLFDQSQILAIRVHRMFLVALGVTLLHAFWETSEDVDTVFCVSIPEQCTMAKLKEEIKLTRI